MPDRIKLTSNDSVKVSKESVLDGEVVQFDLKRRDRVSLPDSRIEKGEKKVKRGPITHTSATLPQLHERRVHALHDGVLDLLHRRRERLIEFYDVCFALPKGGVNGGVEAASEGTSDAKKKEEVSSTERERTRRGGEGEPERTEAKG